MPHTIDRVYISTKPYFYCWSYPVGTREIRILGVPHPLAYRKRRENGATWFLWFKYNQADCPLFIIPFWKTAGLQIVFFYSLFNFRPFARSCTLLWLILMASVLFNYLLYSEFLLFLIVLYNYVFYFNFVNSWTLYDLCWLFTWSGSQWFRVLLYFALKFRVLYY